MELGGDSKISTLKKHSYVQRLIRGFKHDVSAEQRTDLIRNTFEVFSHDDIELHNYEIDLGADKTLCLQLGYFDLLAVSSSCSNIFECQNSMLCACLALVYRCSRDRKFRSFHEIGKTDLIPLLLRIMERSMRNPVTLSPLFEILRIFAKLDAKVKSYLIRWNKSQLIKWLLDFLNNYPSSPFEDKCDVRLDVIGLIRDLSSKSNNEDKEYICDCLSMVLLQHIEDSYDPFLLEGITAIFWNFATLSRLCQKMAVDNFLLKVFGRLLQLEKHIKYVKTKRNALSAMGNVVATLTTAMPNTVESCTIPIEGIVNIKIAFHEQDWFLPTMAELIREEMDRDIQRRAMRTLRCLASCDWGRKRLCKFPGLVSCLTYVVENRTEECDSDTRMQMCQIVGYLTHESDNMKRVGPILESILLQVIEDSLGDYKVTIAACRALSLCMDRSPWKRSHSCFSRKFFNRLFETCRMSQQETANSCVAKFLLQLALDQDMARYNKQERISIVCDPVLCTLAYLISRVGPESEQSRTDAMEVLQFFSKDEATKHRLAENDGILTALVNFALTCTPGKQKNCAKEMILQLVSEL